MDGVPELTNPDLGGAVVENVLRITDKSVSPSATGTAAPWSSRHCVPTPSPG